MERTIWNKQGHLVLSIIQIKKITSRIIQVENLVIEKKVFHNLKSLNRAYEDWVCKIKVIVYVHFVMQAT